MSDAADATGSDFDAQMIVKGIYLGSEDAGINLDQLSEVCLISFSLLEWHNNDSYITVTDLMMSTCDTDTPSVVNLRVCLSKVHVVSLFTLFSVELLMC